MEWKNNVLNKAIIRSNIGGTLRIRSYVPLKGKGLKQVNGKECSNRLFATTPIKRPLVAKGVSAQSPKLQKVYEYDIETIYHWLVTFYKRFFAQQFKRSCLPDGPKVGSVAVSPRGDLRMPSDACGDIWLEELESLHAVLGDLGG